VRCDDETDEILCLEVVERHVRLYIEGSNGNLRTGDFVAIQGKCQYTLDGPSSLEKKEEEIEALAGKLSDAGYRATTTIRKDGGDEGGGGDAGVIVGAIFGVLIGVGLLAGCGWFLYQKAQINLAQQAANPKSTGLEGYNENRKDLAEVEAQVR